MRDVSPRDTAHVINNYTNSFACASHRATAGVTFPNAPGSLNSGLSSPSGSSPRRKVSFLSSSPRLGPAWERVETPHDIIWSDIALGCGFWGDVCASPLHINFLLSTGSHVCCYKVKNGFVLSDMGYSIVFSCSQVIFTEIFLFLSLRKGYFTHFVPATTSAIKGFEALGCVFYQEIVTESLSLNQFYSGSEMPLYYFKAKSKFGLLGKKGKLLDTGTNENNMFREKNAYL